MDPPDNNDHGKEEPNYTGFSFVSNAAPELNESDINPTTTTTTTTTTDSETVFEFEPSTTTITTDNSSVDVSVPLAFSISDVPSFLSEDQYAQFVLQNKDIQKIISLAEEFIKNKDIEIKKSREEIGNEKLATEIQKSEEERKLLEVREQLKSFEQKVELCNKTIESKNTEIEDLQLQIMNLKKEIILKQNNANTQQTQIESLIGEKKNLFNLIASKDGRIESLTEQIKNYTTKIDELFKEKQRSEEETNKAENALLPVLYERDKLAQQLKLVEEQNTLLMQKNAEKSTAYISSTQELNTKVTSLTSEASKKNDHIEELTREVERLKGLLQQTEQRAASYLEKLTANAQEHGIVEASLNKQIHTYKSQLEDYDRTLKEQSRRIEEQVQKINHIKEANFAEITKLQKEISDWRELCKEQEHKIDELESQIERERAKLANASPEKRVDAMLSQGVAENIFEKYKEACEEKIRLQNENHRLNQVLKEILKEVEEKAPLFQDQREEYDRVMVAHVSLMKKYEHLEEASKKMKIELLTNEKELNHLKKASKDLQTENDQLSSQLQAILSENEKLRRTHNPSPASEDTSSMLMGEASSGDTPIDSSAVINQHLVVFTDIQEMQRNNRRLLSVVRSLSEELEKRNKVLKEPDESLKEAQREIEILKTKRAEQDRELQVITKQRDLLAAYTNTTAQNVSIPSASSIVSLTENESKTLQELKSMQAEWLRDRRDFETNMTKAREELFSVQKDVASKNAKIIYLEERLKNADTIQKSLEQEIATLNKSLSDVRKNQEELYDHNRKLQQQLTSTTGELETVKREKEKFEVENNYFRESNALLQASISASKSAREHEGKLFESLQHIQVGLEQTISETKSKYEADIASLKDEIALYKATLNEERTLNKDISSNNERTVDDLKLRIDAKEKEISSQKEEIAKLKTTLEMIKSEKNILVERLSSTEHRLNTLTDQRLASQNFVNVSGDTTETEIQIAELNSKLDLANETIKLERESGQKYKSALHGLEKEKEHLLSLNEKSTQMFEAKFKEKEEENNKLTSEIASLNASVTNLTQENNTLKSQLSDQRKSFEAEKSSILSQQRQNLAEQANVDNTISILRDENRRYIDLWKTAQQKYEYEIIAHSDTIKDRDAIRDSHRAAEAKVFSFETRALKAEEELAKLKASLSEQDSLLKQELDQIKELYADVQRQNVILNSQIETVQRQLKTKESLESTVSDNSTSDSIRTSERELRELASLLKKEKDMHLHRSNIVEQEKKALAARLELALRDVEELKVQLQSNNGKQILEETEYRRLLNQIAELNLYKESNKTLRRELEESKALLNEKSEQVKKLQEEIDPLKAEYYKIKAEIEVHQAERKKLNENLQQYENRFNEIYERSNQIDPEKYKSLEKDNAKLKEDLNSAKTSITNLQNQVEELKKSVEEKTEKIKTLEEQISKFKTQIKKLDEGKKEVEKTMQSLKEDIAEAAKEKAELEDFVRKQKEKLVLISNQRNDWKSKYEQILSQNQETSTNQTQTTQGTVFSFEPSNPPAAEPAKESTTASANTLKRNRQTLEEEQSTAAASQQPAAPQGTAFSFETSTNAPSSSAQGEQPRKKLKIQRKKDVESTEPTSVEEEHKDDNNKDDAEHESEGEGDSTSRAKTRRRIRRNILTKPNETQQSSSSPAQQQPQVSPTPTTTTVQGEKEEAQHDDIEEDDE